MGYDAVLLVSFGGPEGPDDVMPFLRNVVRGRGVPDERLAEVAEHYQHFGGVSPINAQCRELLAALRPDLDKAGVDLPLYWGNRNWQPYLADTLATMRDAGVRRALAFVTSPFGSYSSCRQYLDDIAAARAAVGPRGAGGRQDPALPRSSRATSVPTPTRSGPRCASCPMWSPRLRGWCSPPTPYRPLWTRSSGPDGGRYSAQLRETAALVADGRLPGPALGSGLAVAFRAAAGAVARAGHQRPPRAWPRRASGRGGQPDRVHLRPPGSGLGSRHRGGGNGPPAGAAVRPRGDAGHRPAVRRDGPGLILERLDPATPRRGWASCRSGTSARRVLRRRGALTAPDRPACWTSQLQWGVAGGDQGPPAGHHQRP